MAKKFGGPYSPEGSPDTAKEPLDINRFRGRKTVRSAFREKLLFIAPLPLTWKAFNAEPVVMGQYLAALGILILSAWLTTEGLKAEEAYNERKIARPPAFPRKIFAALLTGLGLALIGIAGYGPLDAAIFAVLGVVLHLLAFGLDPLRKKGMEGVSEFETERVAKAVDKAEALLRETLDAAKRFGDRRLEGRVEKLAVAARDMFRTIEDDPRDLSSARRFLSVYLKGARDATIKFADIYSRKKDTEARTEYEALLTDLETSFNAQRETMLLEDRTDLDIEIETLRDRLKAQGLTTRN